MLKRIFSAFLIICLIFTPALTASAYEPTGFEITANAAMLVSLDTDEILYEKNADAKVYPASITKIMTALVILESDKFDPDVKIAMTEDVLKEISGTGSVVSNLKVGEEITQLDLIYYVLMSSCGDVALLAGNYYAGSVDNFVTMMNAKASELGLYGTHYTNPIGLHDPENYTTARDTFILTKEALKNPVFKEACESTRYTVAATNMSGERTLSTTNFLQDNTTNYYYSYAKGVKTGYTDEAGRCLVSTASYNGYNYMCIVFGCPANEKKHFTESRELYRWAFNNFEFKEVADTDNPVVEVAVDLSFDTDFISLYVEDSFVSVLPKNADDSTIKIIPHLDNETVDAPIKKGDILGTADIIYAEQKLGTVNLISNENVEKSSLLAGFKIFKSIIFSTPVLIAFGIILAAVVAFIISVIVLNKKKTKKRKIKYMPYDHKENRK